MKREFTPYASVFRYKSCVLNLKLKVFMSDIIRSNNVKHILLFSHIMSLLADFLYFFALIYNVKEDNKDCRVVKR